MIVGFTTTMQSVPITTNVARSNPAHGEVYSIQHYVIKFVSDLRQVRGFLRVLRFLHQFKWSPRYNWNIAESSAKHNNLTPFWIHWETNEDNINLHTSWYSFWIHITITMDTTIFCLWIRHTLIVTFICCIVETVI